MSSAISRHVHPGRGFVEHQQLRVRRHAAGDLEAARLAETEIASQHVAAIRKDDCS